MKLNNLSIDAAKAEQGAWVENIPELGDLRLKVRGLNNVDARRMRTELVGALPRALRRDPKEQDRINATIMAETVLLGWENLDGEPYSKKRALEILLDPDYEPFRDGVIWAAATVAEARDTDLKDDSKN